MSGTHGTHGKKINSCCVLVEKVEEKDYFEDFGVD